MEWERKRRVPRVAGERVKIKIYTEDGKSYLEEGLLLDISSCGLQFLSEKSFNLEEKLILEFTLWGKFKFLPLGKIIRIKKTNGRYDYGVEFIRIEPIEKERLSKYVYVYKKIKQIT